MQIIQFENRANQRAVAKVEGTWHIRLKIFNRFVI